MEIRELIDNFEANYGRMLSPFELEDIQKIVNEDGYPIDLVNEALKISIRNGKYFINYVFGILRRMKSRGIMTVQQLKAVEAEKEAETSQIKPTVEFLEMLIAAATMWDDDEDNRAHQIKLYQEKIQEIENRGSYV